MEEHGLLPYPGFRISGVESSYISAIVEVYVSLFVFFALIVIAAMSLLIS